MHRFNASRRSICTFVPVSQYLYFFTSKRVSKATTAKHSCTDSTPVAGSRKGARLPNSPRPVPSACCPLCVCVWGGGEGRCVCVGVCVCVRSLAGLNTAYSPLGHFFFFRTDLGVYCGGRRSAGKQRRAAKSRRCQSVTPPPPPPTRY